MAQTSEQEHNGASPLESFRALQARLRVLEDRRLALRDEGDAMLARFRDRYPDAPAYLVRYADRTHNDFRWRLSSAARWRGNRPARANPTFDLTNKTGQSILEKLPAIVQRNWFIFENKRITLNFKNALVNYEHMRVRDLIARQRLLRQLTRNLESK